MFVYLGHKILLIKIVFIFTDKSKFRVAIKFIAKVSKYLQSERDIMEKMNCPFVIVFFFSIEHESQFCIAMEYLEVNYTMFI